jgi:hypothetical protein
MLYQLSYTPTGSPAKVILSWVPYGQPRVSYGNAAAQP